MKDTFNVDDLLYAVDFNGVGVYEAKVEIVYEYDDGTTREYLIRATSPYAKISSPHIVLPWKVFKTKMLAVQNAIITYNHFMASKYPEELKKLKIIERIKKIS